MDLKNIGKNIKDLRLKKGFTQAQLAEAACISTVHMSHIETGSVAMSIDSLISISIALATTPNDILIGEFNLSPKSTASLAEEYLKDLSEDESRLIIEMAKLLAEIKINRN